MKKIFLHLLVASTFLFPTYAFASVDFTLQEDIASTEKVFTVNVNTQTDVLEELDFSIQYTDGVEITNVKDNSSTCSTLRSVSQNNVLNIVCTFDTPQSVNGVVASVSFDNLTENYSFTLLDDSSLKIGSLVLGEVTNIGNEVLAETDEFTTTTTDDTTLETTVDTTTEVVAETIAETTETVTEAKTITDYLPWILLGGAGILLISIIAIIFSGKKEKDAKTEDTITPEVKPEETTTTETVTTPTMDNAAVNPPTDIDNISNSLYTPQLNTEAVKEETPVQEATPVASAETQMSDLEALKTETPINTEETPALNTESTPQNDFSSFNMNTPVDQPLSQETTMPETPISETPVQTDDIQQSNVPDMSSFDTVPQVVEDNTPTTPGFDIPTTQPAETTMPSFDNPIPATQPMDMNTTQDNFNTTAPVNNVVESPAPVTPPMDNAMPTFDNTPPPQVDTVATPPQDNLSSFNMSTPTTETPTTPMPNLEESTPTQQPSTTIPTDYLSTDTQSNDTDTLPPTPPLM